MTIDLRRGTCRSMPTFIILIAGLALVLASPAISGASPFELKMIGSSGGGSGSSGGSGSPGGSGGGGGGGFGSAGAWSSMKPLTLGKDGGLESIRSAAQDSTPLDQVISSSVVSVPPGPAQPAAGGSSGGDTNSSSLVGTSGNSPTAPLATLDLGGGNHLSVSPEVAQSLQDSIHESTPGQPPTTQPAASPGTTPAAGNSAGSSTTTSGPTGTTDDGSVGNGLPVVGSVLPLLLEDVVTYPGQNGDNIAAAGSEIAEASMPEPASLLLLATGLAVAGMRMRRKI